MDETCDGCGMEYEFSPDNSEIMVYLESPLCNYVKAKCPACERGERIFLEPKILLAILRGRNLSVTFAANAPTKVQEDSARAWAHYHGTTDSVVPAEVDIPPQWLRELYDDLRNWRGEVTP